MSYPPYGPPSYGQPSLSGNNSRPYPPPAEHPHPSYPYYVPGTVMVPVPVMPMPQMPMPQMPMPPMPMPTMPMPGPPQPMEGQPTYITNYIYHGESSNQSDKVQIAEIGGDFDWVPTTTTTAGHLSGKAVLGGHEGWDGSPLWVIRAWHNGDLIPGKLSVRHKSASVMYNGKEIPVQNIEVLCSKPDSLRWVPSSNGIVPPAAIPGGKTVSGEVLYVGRARHQLSITPGKVHPSHNCCYISFGGSEVSHKMYDVLCRIS
ncbi:uncharacterized protein LOC110994130 [Pieris rapae]|uniref:uncharacterized protein LOC110994130 n=1 Tax=Pieris rapae TaxID=64459 RepID=UPI001E27EC81|nr:uncharacterized protein LOC110994130 [Pieris rapae]